MNKIMFKKVDEVVKETKGILKKILKENHYQINSEKYDPQPEEKSRKDTSILAVRIQSKVLHEKKDQTTEQEDLIGTYEQVVVDDTTDK